MTAQTAPPTATAALYLERARSITPLIKAAADAAEERGDVTEEVIEAMIQQNLLCAAVPEDLGGGGLGIRGVIELLEQVTYADGSAGWVLQANLISATLAAGFLPPPGVERMFGGESKPVIATFAQPVCKAREVEGGVIAAGKLRFGSGSTYANWFGCGLQVVDDEGEPKNAPSGMPDMRLAFVPRSGVILQGNWDVMGLVASGSIDFELTEQFIPDELMFGLVPPQPVRDEAAFAVAATVVGAQGHSGVALGITKRALEEAAKLIEGKSRTGRVIEESDLFKAQFAEKEALYQAARAYVLQSFEDIEDEVSAGRVPSPEQAARARQSATWAHTVASEAVDFCQLWIGTPSFRNPSALGRAWRDIAVARTHAVVDQFTLADAATPILEAWRARAGD